MDIFTTLYCFALLLCLLVELIHSQAITTPPQVLETVNVIISLHSALCAQHHAAQTSLAVFASAQHLNKLFDLWSHEADMGKTFACLMLGLVTLIDY